MTFGTGTVMLGAAESVLKAGEAVGIVVVGIVVVGIVVALGLEDMEF